MTRYRKVTNKSSKAEVAGFLGLGCAAVVGLIIIGVALWTLIVMGVWNFILVPAFHLGPIDWIQGFAIAVVLTILQSMLTSGRS